MIQSLTPWAKLMVYKKKQSKQKNPNKNKTLSFKQDVALLNIQCKYLFMVKNTIHSMIISAVFIDNLVHNDEEGQNLASHLTEKGPQRQYLKLKLIAASHSWYYLSENW